MFAALVIVCLEYLKLHVDANIVINYARKVL